MKHQIILQTKDKESLMLEFKNLYTAKDCLEYLAMAENLVKLTFERGEDDD